MKQIYTHFTAVLFCIATHSSAQSTTPAPCGIGLRLTPDGGGVSGKCFFSDHLNFEAMFNGSGGTNSYAYRSTVFVGLFEYNHLLANPAWHIYVGPGIHCGTRKKSRPAYGDLFAKRENVFGFDLIAGVEYSMRYVPIGVSFDIKPGINSDGGLSTFPNNMLGLGVTYYFGSWAGVGFRTDHIYSGR